MTASNDEDITQVNSRNIFIYICLQRIIIWDCFHLFLAANKVQKKANGSDKMMVKNNSQMTDGQTDVLHNRKKQ